MREAHNCVQLPRPTQMYMACVCDALSLTSACVWHLGRLVMTSNHCCAVLSRFLQLQRRVPSCRSALAAGVPDGVSRVCVCSGVGLGVGPGVVLLVVLLARDPDGGAALEAGPEAQLPHAVALLDALEGLNVGPCIPAGRTQPFNSL